MFIQFARNSVITSGIPHEVEEYFSASMNILFMDGIVWILDGERVAMSFQSALLTYVITESVMVVLRS